ncbi:MAG TPA: enoyl-CoA hydratase/isomerase family protein [Ktedonobacteraceae bacterium]|nr:enoyl-CoA hydratase/isomerase family protein [Ktedonobacteraceae bacterium]
MSTLELETMRCEVNGLLARLRLNRPEVLNAANRAWVQDLVTVTDFLTHDVQARVVLVSGEGRAFSSGMDTKELARENITIDWFETWERGVTALAELNAITIAAIQGYCLGGGLQLALACDLRIASSDAIFSIPAVKEGVAAYIATVRLARLIGAAAAKELCLLGRRFSAEEARALRLVTEVVPLTMLEERALAMAQELLSIPFPALLYTKRQIDRAFSQDIALFQHEMTAVYEDCLRSTEHAAVKAELKAREKTP